MGETLQDLGARIQEQLAKVLENAGSFRDLAGGGAYRAFLHGQASGLALALKIMFPGDGDLGEQAAAQVASVMGENKCGCHHHDMEEAPAGE